MSDSLFKGIAITIGTQLFITCNSRIIFRVSIISVIISVATFVMESQIVDAINYIKNISKKKPLGINNPLTNNWDKEFVEDTLYELRTKCIID